MTYSEMAKKLRLPLGFVFGIAYLIWARPTVLTLAVGGAIAFVGVVVRAWASGHIVKNRRLAVSGPYAHTRNPLYFGSFLIAAGFAIAAHWSFLLIVVAFFALVSSWFNWWVTLDSDERPTASPISRMLGG